MRVLENLGLMDDATRRAQIGETAPYANDSANRKESPVTRDRTPRSPLAGRSDGSDGNGGGQGRTRR